MKLGRYVIADDGGNYVTFHDLNVSIKIKKNNYPSQRELGLPVFQVKMNYKLNQVPRLLFTVRKESLRAVLLPSTHRAQGTMLLCIRVRP